MGNPEPYENPSPPARHSVVRKPVPFLIAITTEHSLRPQVLSICVRVLG
jgi:hypothetical protein